MEQRMIGLAPVKVRKPGGARSRRKVEDVVGWSGSDHAGMDAPCRCPNCGEVVDPLETNAMKRGAVTVTGLPRVVFWKGREVGLSPTQAEIFATIAKRGRASFEAIDEAMSRFGASPQTRSIHILRIRRKFAALGAKDPFQRIGNSGFRLVIEPDAADSSSTVIGLRTRG